MWVILSTSQHQEIVPRLRHCPEKLQSVFFCTSSLWVPRSVIQIHRSSRQKLTLNLTARQRMRDPGIDPIGSYEMYLQHCTFDSTRLSKSLSLTLSQNWIHPRVIEAVQRKGDTQHPSSDTAQLRCVRQYPAKMICTKTPRLRSLPSNLRLDIPETQSSLVVHQRLPRQRMGERVSAVHCPWDFLDVHAVRCHRTLCP